MGGVGGGVWEGGCARIIFSKILDFYGYFLNRIKQAFLGCDGMSSVKCSAFGAAHYRPRKSFIGFFT